MLIAIFFLAIFGAVTVGMLLATARAKQASQTVSRLKAVALGPQSPAAAEEPLNVRRQELLSSIPWLDKLLHKADMANRLRLLLYQADIKSTSGGLVLKAFLAGLAGFLLVYLRTGVALVALPIGAAAATIPFVYVVRRRNKRFDKMKQLMPETLDLMVAALRAGHGFVSALGMAARESAEPVRKEFRQCFDEQNFGLDLRTSMLNLAHRMPLRDVRMFVTGVLIQKTTGGNLTEILENIAHLIREDFRLQRQVRVHTAQGRMTGWILSILPLVLGFAFYMLDPDRMSILWTRSIGLKLLGGAAAMTLIGGLIIRKIVKIRI